MVSRCDEHGAGTLGHRVQRFLKEAVLDRLSIKEVAGDEDCVHGLFLSQPAEPSKSLKTGGRQSLAQLFREPLAAGRMRRQMEIRSLEDA